MKPWDAIDKPTASELRYWHRCLARGDACGRSQEASEDFLVFARRYSEFFRCRLPVAQEYRRTCLAGLQRVGEAI